MTEDVSISQGLLLYLILMASVCLHEWAHAFVADRFGDPTPRLDGRTSLNPAAHFDPIGTGLMPLAIIFLIPFFAPFGWGKRIILNAYNFDRPKLAEISVWSAGPLMNLLLSLVASFLGGIAWRFGYDASSLVVNIVKINAILLLLNVLPFPPLDGGHVLRLLTNMREEMFVTFSQWGFLILLGLIFFVPPFQAALNFILSIILALNQMAFSLSSGGALLFG